MTICALSHLSAYRRYSLAEYEAETGMKKRKSWQERQELAAGNGLKARLSELPAFTSPHIVDVQAYARAATAVLPDAMKLYHLKRSKKRGLQVKDAFIIVSQFCLRQ